MFAKRYLVAAGAAALAFGLVSIRLIEPNDGVFGSYKVEPWVVSRRSGLGSGSPTAVLLDACLAAMLYQ